MEVSHPGHHRRPLGRITRIARRGQTVFGWFPFAYTPAYPDRGGDEPAPIYSAQALEQMQRRLAAVADIAVQQEIERDYSNSNETQAPMRDAA